MTIGERLREERERMGLSQPKFAALAGTTKQTLFSWESGRTAPNGFQFAALDAAGADVCYIITGDREGPLPLSPEEQLMLDRYRTSSRSLKDAALRVLLGGESSENGTKSQPSVDVSGKFKGHVQQINAPVKGVVVGRDFVNQGRKKKRETGDQQ